jgi:Protein of unknown function (DUF3592)
MDALFEFILKSIVWTFKAFVCELKASGTSRWSLANATVTAPPISSSGIVCPTVEIVYSYRVQGELYTGFHEESFLLSDTAVDYVDRFGEGRNLVVRVKPDNPEVSVVRERDQGALTQSQLEQLTS